MWPRNSAVKKPPIMTNVQKVRVIKFAFFFSYSASFCSAGVDGTWSDDAPVSTGRRGGRGVWGEAYLVGAIESRQKATLGRRSATLLADFAHAEPPAVSAIGLVVELDPAPLFCRHGGGRRGCVVGGAGGGRMLRRGGGGLRRANRRFGEQVLSAGRGRGRSGDVSRRREGKRAAGPVCATQCDDAWADLGGCWQVGVWGRGKWVLAGLLNDELKFRFSLPSYVNLEPGGLAFESVGQLPRQKRCSSILSPANQDNQSPVIRKRSPRGTRGRNNLQPLDRTGKTMNGLDSLHCHPS